MPISPPDFVAAEVLSEPWGTLTLQFTGDDVAVSWDSVDPDFADGKTAMIRLTELAGHTCQ